MWKTTLLRRWQFKLLILGLGIVAAIFDQVSMRFTVPLILIVVVFGIEQMYDLHHDAQKAITSAMEALSTLATTKHLDEVATRIKIKQNEVAIAAAINRHHGPIGQALEHVHEVLTGMLEIKPFGFIIYDHNFALRNYSVFWRSLVKEQEKRTLEGEGGLTALVLHSCSIEIWQGMSFSDCLSEQRDFIKAGGRIDRILCSRKDAPTEDYRSVAQKMKAVGIAVTYYNIELGERGHNFSWDFLVIKELQRAVIWKSGANGEINEAAYTNERKFETEDLVETWERIAANAFGFDKAAST